MKIKQAHGRLCAVVVAILAVVGLMQAYAQEPTLSAPANGVTDALTVQEAEARLERARTAPGLDEATRAQVVALYEEALEQVRRAEDWAAKASGFAQALEAGPAEIERLQQELQEPLGGAEPEVSEHASLGDLEQALSDAKQALQAAQAAAAALEADLAGRAERRRQLPELMALAEERLAEAGTPVAAEGALAPVLEAGLVAETARRQALRAEGEAYRGELQSYDVRGRLVKLRRDLAARQVVHYEKVVRAWERVVRARREEEARKAAEQARQAVLEAAHAGPAIRQFAADLASTTEELIDKRIGPEGRLTRIEETARLRRRIEEELDRVRGDFQRITQKVDAAGLNNAIGLLLRRHKASLPDARQHERNVRARQQVIADVQFEQIVLGEERMRLPGDEARLDTLVAGMDPDDSAKHRDSVANLLRDMLQGKRDALDALDRDYDTHFEELVDVDSAERALVEETREFEAYIDERILWIRSGPAFALDELPKAWAGLQWLFRPRHAVEMAQTAGKDFAKQWPLHACALLGIGALIWARRRCGGWLATASKAAASPACAGFRPTAEALAATLLRAALVPGVVWYVGWRLAASMHGTDFASSAGSAMKSAALVLALFEILRRFACSDGVFEAHFGWPSAPVQAFRRHVLWFMWVCAVAAFVIILVGWQGEDIWQAPLGRLVLFGLFAALAAFAHRMLGPGSVPSRSLRAAAGPWLFPLCYVLVLAAVAALALLTGFGFTYTALRLCGRLYVTASLTATLLIARALILRLLLVTRRRLAMEQRRARRRLAEEEGGELPDEDAGLDLAKLSTQTRRLVRNVSVFALLIAIWLVWVDELPALRVMDKIELWDTAAVVNRIVTDPEGREIVQPENVTEPVTLADVAGALLIALLTFTATANVPGLLELAVLRRLKWAAGERYAFKTVVRYAITLLGVVLAFHAIGIGWSSIQWLVAAIGLGLGFGLQEIFANFISGLIILFERPIRVGDTVTVGGISGTVSRIRMRATWITEFDRKELVVPNKEFVTNQLVNWTLSDSILRLIVPVGIAYGSDTALAERLLYDVAARNPHVVDEPAPIVLFTEFGGSSLTFELRVYCADVDTWLQLRHELHMEIDRVFRDAGIEIAFPQHDVHIRSIRDDLRLARPEPPGEEG
ncbi:MAG: mechanosensitive ion channel [Candidatus Hydrogenedentes bacterium]|nr:mechanosensitive ion channel [Candidatus Hydrogenedentota bacterium]